MADDSNPPDDKPDFRDSLGRFIIPPFVNDPDKRSEKWGLPADDNTPGDYIIELNLLYETGLDAASLKFKDLHRAVVTDPNRQPTLNFQELLQMQDQRQRGSRPRPQRRAWSRRKNQASEAARHLQGLARLSGLRAHRSLHRHGEVRRRHSRLRRHRGPNRVGRYRLRYRWRTHPFRARQRPAEEEQILQYAF